MVNRMGMLWTNEEVNSIKVAINNGAQLDELCEMCGRTPYAIISKLTALRILVDVNQNYHLINPDPWALGTAVHAMQRGVKKEDEK